MNATIDRNHVTFDLGGDAKRAAIKRAGTADPACCRLSIAFVLVMLCIGCSTSRTILQPGPTPSPKASSSSTPLRSHYVSSGGIVDDTVRERIMLAYATRLADDRAERVAHKLANVTT